MNEWKREETFFKLGTPWVTFYGEYLRDERGKRLEYYRVEKADSVIVLPVQKAEGAEVIYAPENQYRSGVGKSTLDFPGGRVDEEIGLEASAVQILKRELGVDAAPESPEGQGSKGKAGESVSVELLTKDGYLLNSSFSDQKMHVALARIPESVEIPDGYIGASYTLDREGVSRILSELDCAQCRLALYEYLFSEMKRNNKVSSTP